MLNETPNLKTLLRPLLFSGLWALLGCTGPGPREESTSEPPPLSIRDPEPKSTVESDKEQIEMSLRTMDEYQDRSIPEAKMRGLIQAGLYDPENKNPLEVGQAAPDFALMPLRFYDFRLTTGITKDNAGSLFEPVTLSSFRGKKPVVLIFGSYT